MRTIDALRTVDDALASGRARSSDPEERELQEIALALRADAPAPDPSFAARLDGRVARRFSREPPARSRLPRRRLLLAGAAGLLAVVAVGGAVAGLSGRDENPSIQSARPAVTEAQPDGASGLALGARAPRRVERDAQLTLAATA